MLNYDSGGFKIWSNFLFSYIATLGEVELTSLFTERIDSTAEQNLSRFNDLAIDISRALMISISVIRVAKPTHANMMEYTSTIIKMVEDAWTDDSPTISATFEALLSVGVPSDKDGYKIFLKNICHNGTLESPSEHLFALVDKLVNILRQNLSAYGVTHSIIINPRNRADIVVKDGRFSDIFRNSPFVARLPTDTFVSIYYNDFVDNGIDNLND